MKRAALVLIYIYLIAGIVYATGLKLALPALSRAGYGYALLTWPAWLYDGLAQSAKPTLPIPAWCFSFEDAP